VVDSNMFRPLYFIGLIINSICN